MMLLTPGPVTTRPEVRAAMACDIAPWDTDFTQIYASVRERLRVLAGGIEGAHVGFALQGCGHFAMEAALRTFVPRGGKVLIPETGQYAERMARLTAETGRLAALLPVRTNERVDPETVAAALRADPSISHVGLVYSETSSGVVHDVAAVGAAARACGRRTLIDAISAFGALPVDMAAMPEADAVIFTSNKCLEALPGLGFAVARVDRLRACAGNAESWCMDYADMYAAALESGWGAFRFTPPAQVLNAVRVALDLLDAEGGPRARLARYTKNMRTLYDGVRSLGLAPCLPVSEQGPIVMNVHTPADPGWSLQAYVNALKGRGVLISNFHCTEFPSMRIGAIGALTAADMERAVAAMGAALGDVSCARAAA